MKPFIYEALLSIIFHLWPEKQMKPRHENLSFPHDLHRPGLFSLS